MSSTARQALSLSLVCAASACCAQTAPAAHSLLAASLATASPQPIADLPDAPSYTIVQQQPATPAGVSTSAPPAPDATAPPPNETEAQKKERERLEAEKQLKAEEKQRLAGVVPNFNVVMGGTALPLSAGQKFDLAFHSITDPYPFATAALLAGYSELIDSHTGFHHGPEGYFKRAGASYADTAIGTMVGNALLPVILKQDPRYFRKGTGTVKSRMIYSALTAFICHGDNGKNQFNYSNVLGNFISGAISNVYYPSDESGIGLTLENGVVVTAEGMIGAQVLEFGPDVVGHFARLRREKKQRQMDANTAAAAAIAAKQGTTPPATAPAPAPAAPHL